MAAPVLATLFARLLCLLLAASSIQAEPHGRHHHHRHHSSSPFLGHRYYDSELDEPVFSHQNARRHHRHHHPQFALASMEASLNEGTMDLGALELEAEASPDQVQHVYSKPHPLVEERLETMDDQLKDLKSSQGQASGIIQEMRDSQAEAMKDMSRGVALHRIMVGAKADVYAQDKVLKNLHDEEPLIQSEHDNVVLKLKAIRGPRVSVLEHELIKHREAVTRREAEEQQWEQARAKHKDIALQMIADRGHALKTLEKSQEAIKEAERRERIAKEAYEEAAQKVSREVESYKVSQARYEASGEQIAEARVGAEKAKDSLSKTVAIFQAEEVRIDKALKISQAKLRKRMKMAETQQQKAKLRFKLARERLAAWNSKQKRLEQHVSDLKAQYEGRQQDIYNKRATIVASATDKAGERATSQSDFSWNDWAWSAHGDVGSDAEDTQDISLDSSLDM